MKQAPVECNECDTIFESNYVPDTAEPGNQVSGVRCQDCGFFGPMTVKRADEANH